MLKELLSKALAKNKAVVRQGAKNAQRGKQGLAVDAFARKGREAKAKRP